MNRLLTLLFAWLVLSTCARADIDAVRELGLRPNDFSFDNGKLISEAVAAGLIRDTLHFPGGIYYHSTPVVLSRNALKLTGQGLQRWARSGALENTAAVVFVYLGPADEPAWVVSGDGCRIEGINIWRDFYPPPRASAGTTTRRDGTGLQIRDWGKLVMRHCGLAGFDTGIHFAPSNHCDNLLFESVHFFACRRCVFGEENQAALHDWRGLHVYGNGQIVFDVQGGGNWHVSSLMLNEPRLVLRLAAGSNTCTYSIENLKVDNNAAGWRLLEMANAGPLNLTVRGHIGNHARMGERPIVLKRPRATRTWTPPDEYQHLDIELWGAHPGEQGALWRPTVEELR